MRCMAQRTPWQSLCFRKQQVRIEVARTRLSKCSLPLVFPSSFFIVPPGCWEFAVLSALVSWPLRCLMARVSGGLSAAPAGVHPRTPHPTRASMSLMLLRRLRGSCLAAGFQWGVEVLSGAPTGENVTSKFLFKGRSR